MFACFSPPRREHRTSGNEFNKQTNNFVHSAAAGGIGRHCGEASLWGDIPADRPTPDVSGSGRMLCGPGSTWGSVQRGSESGGVAIAHFRAYILSQIHYYFKFPSVSVRLYAEGQSRTTVFLSRKRWHANNPLLFHFKCIQKNVSTTIKDRHGRRHLHPRPQQFESDAVASVCRITVIVVL